MIVPISDRARKYGYFIWPKAADSGMQTLLAGAQTVELSFNGAAAGTKNVDWKHRRISVGPKLTRDMPETASSFVIEFEAPKLTVTTTG